MENNRYPHGQKMYDLVKEVIDVTGPRLPGSEEEKQGAKIIADQIQRELGASPRTETFKTPRHACISAIPWLGWGAFIAFAGFYLSPIASLAISAFLLLFALTHIFYYSHLLDPLFPKDQSQNVYAVIPPKSGEAKYNVILSAHMDSSWCWLHSYKNPNTMMIKTGLGVLSVVILMIVSIVTIILEASTSISFMALSKVFANMSANSYSGKDIAIMIMYCLPVLCLPGFYFLTQYLSYDKKIAAPGAMDNLSGVAMSIEVIKHFQNSEDEIAKDAKFIVLGTGAEESGLIGAMAFAKAHKDDKELVTDNTYAINLDSFRDMEHFNVVKKDTLQFIPFDKELIELSKQAIENCNLQSHIIENPVGGSDSTAFAKAGIKTITLNAQDPRPTDYYHTTNDGMDNLNIDTLEKGFDVVVELIRLIDNKHKA
ncbi:MAG: Zn-dependent exopeptidase M28 [Clostridia bacterium]|nr:Zn-dependent exopeptidase M28 [Clostridia bacterium]